MNVLVRGIVDNIKYDIELNNIANKLNEKITNYEKINEYYINGTMFNNNDEIVILVPKIFHISLSNLSILDDDEYHDLYIDYINHDLHIVILKFKEDIGLDKSQIPTITNLKNINKKYIDKYIFYFESQDEIFTVNNFDTKLYNIGTKNEIIYGYLIDKVADMENILIGTGLFFEKKNDDNRYLLGIVYKVLNDKIFVIPNITLKKVLKCKKTYIMPLDLHIENNQIILKSDSEINNLAKGDILKKINNNKVIIYNDKPYIKLKKINLKIPVDCTNLLIKNKIKIDIMRNGKRHSFIVVLPEIKNILEELKTDD
jgi:hypothetical protein